MKWRRAKLDSSARIVIPAEDRKALGLLPGSEVLICLEAGEIRLTTRVAQIRKVQDLVCKYVPPGVSLVDELIAERREEARRELED